MANTSQMYGGPNPGQSGSDPRGRTQNQGGYQQQRYEQQQGPMANIFAQNYGQGAGQGFVDYNNQMNLYNRFLGGGGGGAPQQQPIGPSGPAYNPNAIPTLGGQQVGSGTPWAPGAQAPTGGPAGYSWNPDMAMYQPGGQGGGGNFDPSTYNPKDPASVDAYIAYMQQQPGVNPSVINDPGYWRQKMLADPNSGGGLGPDANYVKQKMMTPEGAPAGDGQGGFGTLQSFQQMSPEAKAYFASAGRGFQNFADTGGYSPADIANMRSRGVAPIRAAYAAAQRGIGQQRELQGGYAPNAIASMAKMAREQGQGMSDATQNVEAQLAQARNQGRQFGNTGLASLGSAQGGLGLNYSQLGQQGVLGALSGMGSLYGTNAGLTSAFGNQLLNAVGQGGQIGQSQYGNDIRSQTLPGAFQNTMDKIGGVANAAGAVMNPLQQYLASKKKQQSTGQTGQMYPTGGGGQAQLPPGSYEGQPT